MTYHVLQTKNLQAGDIIRTTRAVVESVETTEGLTTIRFAGRTGDFTHRPTTKVGIYRREEVRA